MSLLNNNIWEVSGLPKGLSCNGGVISGTPTERGTFSAPVTVTNPLGTSTKTIKIITRYRPGTEKFSILQNGLEIEKVTISQLQKMVQDGTAQEKYNCTNTQIVIPVTVPPINYFDTDDDIYNLTPKTLSDYMQNVAINFCSFRNVTLQDGTEKPGLILQFDKCLWGDMTPFHTAIESPHNRWRYSQLRQWLNSSGLNWFSPAYNGDELVDYFTYKYGIDYKNSTLEEKISKILEEKISNSSLSYKEKIDYLIDDGYGLSMNDVKKLFRPALQTTYADKNFRGFLDYLPSDLADILQPVKIQTFAYYEENEDRFEAPEFILGYDMDITYDKVFIPSIFELGFTQYSSNDKAVENNFTPWEFYVKLFKFQDWKVTISEAVYDHFIRNLVYDLDISRQIDYYEQDGLYMTRSCFNLVKEEVDDNSIIFLEKDWREGTYGPNYYLNTRWKKPQKAENVYIAPAFVIC